MILGCPSPVTLIETPSSFTQKALVEEYTGTWCGYCPDGAYILQQLIDSHPGVVYGAAYHYGDPMEIPEGAELAAGVGGCQGYPMGAVNRTGYLTQPIIMSRSYWAAAVDQVIGGEAPAACGLKLETSLSGGSATLEVSVGFHELLSGDLRLAVFLIEDYVAMADSNYYQRNYYDQAAGSPFFGRGEPIPDYAHMHVVRDYLTSVFGEGIAASSTGQGKGIQRKYAYLVPSDLKSADLKVLAIVAKYGPGATDSRAILNVQEVPLGQSKDWD